MMTDFVSEFEGGSSTQQCIDDVRVSAGGCTVQSCTTQLYTGTQKQN